MRAGAIVALVWLALWPGAAHAEWLEASSEHFVIYTDDTESDATRFSQQLERYHSALELLTGRTLAKPSPSNRVTVYVVKSEAAVRKLLDARGSFIAGFYIPRAGGSLAVIPAVDSAKRENDFSMVTLLHEYAHHFISSTSSRQLPRWLSEGSAEFFSSCSFKPDGGMVVAKPNATRAAELAYAQDVKVSELFDPSEYEKHRGKSRTYDAFYGKSWLLYHYLSFDKPRTGQLARYIDLLGQGKGQREAATSAFGDFGKLDGELRAYLQRSTMTALDLPPAMLRTGAVAIRRLRAGEAAVMAAQVRTKLGVDTKTAPAALAAAKAAATRFPDDPAVLAELAEASFDAGDDQAAIAAADAALAKDPGQVTAYVQKGYALFRQAAKASDRAAAYHTARQPFIALNRRENDNPLPLLYFYLSYVEQGQTPPPVAIQGLSRAAELAPFDLGLRMTLATAMIRLGRKDDARLALDPVAHNPHGGPLSKAANTMLARLDSEPGWTGADLPDAVEEGAADEGGT